jgi:hypothetical protein
MPGGAQHYGELQQTLALPLESSALNLGATDFFFWTENRDPSFTAL